MAEYTPTAKRVKKLLYDKLLATGRAPNVGRIGRELGITPQEVLAAIKELWRVAVLQPRTENILMVHPFSNITTPYEIEVDGQRKWYAE
jgi:hypothetical protein